MAHISDTKSPTAGLGRLGQSLSDLADHIMKRKAQEAKLSMMEFQKSMAIKKNDMSQKQYKVSAFNTLVDSGLVPGSALEPLAKEIAGGIEMDLRDEPATKAGARTLEEAREEATFRHGLKMKEISATQAGQMTLAEKRGSIKGEQLTRRLSMEEVKLYNARLDLALTEGATREDMIAAIAATQPAVGEKPKKEMAKEIGKQKSTGLLGIGKTQIEAQEVYDVLGKEEGEWVADKVIPELERTPLETIIEFNEMWADETIPPETKKRYYNRIEQLYPAILQFIGEIDDKSAKSGKTKKSE